MIGAIFAGVGSSIAASLYGLWVKNGRLRSMSGAGAEEHSGPSITGALATTYQTENPLPSQNQVLDSAKVFGRL